MNEYQKERFTKRIISCLYNNLAGKKLAVLGFAFKKDTSDTRESPAITLVSNFVAERSRVAIYDPQVPAHQIWHELADNGCNPDMLEQNVSICQSAYAACESADAVVLMTDWDEFSNKSAIATLATEENQHPLTNENITKYTTPHATPKATNQEASSPARSEDEITTSFRLPSRRSAGVVIKDPRNGEIKTFNVKRPSFGSGLLQSSTANSDSLPSPAHLSRDLRLRDPNILPAAIVSHPRTVSTNAPMSSTALPSRQPVAATCLLQTVKSSIDERLQAVEITSKPIPTGKLDWARIADKMRRPMFVFDGRNALDHSKLEALGFRVEAIGKRGTAIQETDT